MVITFVQTESESTHFLNPSPMIDHWFWVLDSLEFTSESTDLKCTHACPITFFSLELRADLKLTAWLRADLKLTALIKILKKTSWLK